MKQTSRLDKFLCHAGLGTRKEVKELIKRGEIFLNGEKACKPELSITLGTDQVFYQGHQVAYDPFLYLMLHKPAGYVSATEDKKEKTVMELLPAELQKKELFIAGRLDKNTEGFLLLTNDGPFAHALLSPKKHIPKLYYAKIDGPVSETVIELFSQGLSLPDGTLCKSALLEILSCGEISEIHLTITEGKFHQVKRMFEAVGRKVLYLKRMQIGLLPLDPALPLGCVRRITPEELLLLSSIKKTY